MNAGPAAAIGTGDFCHKICECPVGAIVYAITVGYSWLKEWVLSPPFQGSRYIGGRELVRSAFAFLLFKLTAVAIVFFWYGVLAERLDVSFYWSFGCSRCCFTSRSRLQVPVVCYLSILQYRCSFFSQQEEQTSGHGSKLLEGPSPLA